MKRKNGQILGGNVHFGTSDKKSQDEKGLAELLKEHDERGVVPFHMPGHKRGAYDFLFGAQKIDITEIDGFDNLHDASGVILDAEKRASKLYGTICSRFLVGGSTAGVLASIRALTKEGDKVLVARNCHKSVYNAVELCRLVPVYVEPTYFEEYGFYGSVSPESVKEAFEKDEDIKLVVITSPTYEGIISDIKSIADICHERGALLFVDEAHGAHLGLCKGFEKSARQLGADVVVNSLHKTLPSLTQTAILHVCTDRADIKRIDKNLAVFQSSSPSYVLMASIDGCVRFLQNYASEAMGEWSKNLDAVRKSFSHLVNVKLFDGKKDGRVFGYDKSKLVFCVGGCAFSGVEFKKKLRVDCDIELEMASVNYAIAMSGLGDDKASFSKLAKAVFDIDASAKTRDGLTYVKLPKLPQKVFEPYQIDTLSCEYVDFAQSVGRVCAENAWAYPPGCPVIVKGERVEEDFVKYATLAYESGVNVTSESREFPAKLAVVQNGVDLP